MIGIEKRIEAAANYYASLMPTNDALVLDKIKGHYINGALQEANRTDKMCAAMKDLLKYCHGKHGESKVRAADVKRAKQLIKEFEQLNTQP